ncbi:MAG: PAS domain S-box protein [Candidatus Electrothrix sp. AR1]|nr:PAS domain S-box protein [Candidatus Electrothrix sp. AR1]
MKIRSILLILLFFYFVPLSPCQGNSIIRVGIYDNAPIVYQTNDGKPHGLSIEVLQYIAAKEDWTLEYVFGSWSQCLDRLEKGEIDIQVYIAYTEDRAKKYDYSQQTLIGNWGVVYSNFENSIETILDLKDKRVALLSQGVHARAFKQSISEFKIPIEIIYVDTHHAAFQLVSDKKADAAVTNRIFGMSNAKSYNLKVTPIIFNPIEIRYAMPKGKNGKLGKAIDHHLQKLKADKNSFYHESLDNMLGQPNAIIPQWLICSLIGTGSIGIIFFIWLVMLRKQIRQRKIVEKALLDSENRFRSLSDAAFEGIVITEKGNILDANNALAKMLGYPIGELICMNAFDFIISEERHNVKSKILSGSERPYESNCLKKDGSTFPIEIHAKICSYQDRQVNVIAIRNLSKQKEAEEEIRTLRDIIPICSLCKNIRNDQGYYEQIEAYIHRYSGVDFSHTICPQCMEKHYPEEYKKIIVKKKS